MIAKRVGAALLAVLLIVGAWFVRDRVIDDDGSADASPDETDEPSGALRCVAELRAVCQALAGEFDSVEVRIEPAGDTLDDQAGDDAEPAMWLTMAPLPEMVDALRQSRGLSPISATATPLATSSLALVVRPSDRQQVVETCGDPVDLACLDDVAELQPTFSSLDTASGTLGVAAAASAFGGAALDVNNPQFAVWARNLKRASRAQLSGGTAIQTIQTRQTFGIAIGAVAELSAARRPDFQVIAPAASVNLAVVLSVPEGQLAPTGLAASATASLEANGWDPPLAGATTTGLPDPGVILVVRNFWEDL